MKSKLIAVISPAKLLDDQSHYPQINCTQPAFLTEAEILVKKLKKLPASKLSELMDLSPKLGEENRIRYQKWSLPFTHDNAHPAILMFKGEVYRGLQAEELSKPQLDFAQKHLRILSGLYGLNKPLDLIMPYRLMMGTPYAPDAKHKNLYAFWGNKITESLKNEMAPSGILVNLASHEYFKSIDTKTLERRVISCEFKEKKGDKFSVVSTFAKLARGKMARFLIDHWIEKPEDLKAFDTDNYKFNPGLSDSDNFVFTRG